jgi:protoporphyrin/coproporphyrin ferrochelatase
VVALNLGGPDSLDEVGPFLERLFADPDVIQLGWLRFAQPMLARFIARRRTPLSREAYAQIGGRSPIRAESTAQATAVAQALESRGIAARPYVAMSCSNPLAPQTVAAMKGDGIERAIALPLFPHYSHTTTGSAFKLIDKAAAGTGIELAHVDRYPDAPGYLQALTERLSEAIATLPDADQGTAPILFSAHGLPESYIEKGDPYLDDIRVTVAAVIRRMGLGSRAQLCFQSRVGRQKWLGPYTEEAIDRVASDGFTALVVCPVAFTGEHIETLQEIDILYRDRALERGIRHFARARTVGCHPAFIEALADLTLKAARDRGWIGPA